MCDTKTAGSEARSLSRRNFLRLSIGSLTLLPTVASMALLPDEVAYADERHAELTDGSKIYVVKPNEIGIVLHDVTVPEGDEDAIVGASVKITSRFNDKTVEGVTDDDGGIVFDISDLAEDDGKSQSPMVYAFNGTIEVSASGYRDFRMGLSRFEGNKVMAVPDQPLDEGVPYPALVSFNDWDVLYTADDFVSSSTNDADHTIVVELEECPAGSVTASLLADGTEVANTTAQAGSDGKATLSFTGAFLQQDGKQALPVGSDHAFSVIYSLGSTDYEVPLKFTVSEAPADAQDPQVGSDLDLLPFSDPSTFATLTIPKGIPAIGGTKFKLWEPAWPVNIAFDPTGYVRLSVDTPPWGYYTDTGQPDPDRWKFHPRRSVQQQWQRQYDKMMSQMELAEEARARDGKVRQIGFSEKFSLLITAEAVAAAVRDASQGDTLYRGKASIQLRFGINFTFTENFLVGPVPIVVQFSIGLNGTAGGGVATITPAVLDFSKYQWDYTSTGFTFQIAFTPALSAGVGIAGFATVSLKGAFSLTFYLTIGPLPEGYEDKPTPRLCLSLKAVLSVEIETFLFTKSVELASYDVPGLYDNWSGSQVQNVDPYRCLTDGMSLAEVFEDAKIITESSLADLAEFTTAGFGSGGPQEKKMPLYEFKSKDGKHVGYLLAVTDATVTAMKGLVASGAGKATGADADVHVATLVGERAGARVWTGALPAFDPTGEHDYVPIPVGTKSGVSGLGSYGGFRPDTDVRIADKILSDSHLQVVHIADKDYIARICAVKIGDDKVRTRVVFDEIDGDERRVIDFNYGDESHNRDDYFDYDFSVCVVDYTSSYGYNFMGLFVISGRRDDGDATSLGAAAGTTLFSVCYIENWQAQDPEKVYTATAVDPSQVDATGADKDAYPYRFYSCPQVRFISDAYSNGHVFSYLERAAATETDLYGDDPKKTVVGAGLFFNTFEGDSSGDFWVVDMDKLRDAVTGIGDASVTELRLSERIDWYHTLMLKGTDVTHYVQVKTDASCYKTESPDIYMPGIPEAKVADPGEVEEKHLRLVPVPDKGCFFATVDGKLKRVTWDNGADVPHPQLEDMGDNELNISDFAVSAEGNMVFWPARRDKDPGYHFDENGKVVPSGEPELHQLLAARVRGDKLSKPFPFCEVDHDMHQIQTVAADDDALHFLSIATTDLEAGKGELWYTAVPYVRCVSMLNIDPSADIVARGDNLQIRLTLRNDGNVYLLGVEGEIRRTGDTDAVSTFTLDFSEDTTLESEWNPRDDDGNLIGVEDDYALAPGMTSRYLAAAFTIPDTWEGDTELEVTITSLKEAPLAEEEMTAQPERNVVDYIPKGKLTGRAHVGTSKDSTDGSELLGAADVAAPNGSGRLGGKRKTKLSGMGDKNGAAVAGLLALGGAALAAYGKRRADVERERREQS